MPILNGEHIGEMIFSVFLGMVLPFLITVGTTDIFNEKWHREELLNAGSTQFKHDTRRLTIHYFHAIVITFDPTFQFEFKRYLPNLYYTSGEYT